MQIVQKVTLAFTLIFLTHPSFGQNSSMKMNYLFEAIAQSIKEDNSATSIWTTCNNDSAFFNQDTIELYNNLHYQQEQDCCNFLNWQFVDQTHIKQSFSSTCNEFSNKAINRDSNTIYSLKYIQEDDFVKMEISKDKTITTYEVVAIEMARLPNNLSCYKLTLARSF